MACCCAVLEAGDLHQELLDSCIDSFDRSFWNAATIGDYKVQNARDKQEQRKQ